jgi:hypothetical protein
MIASPCANAEIASGNRSYSLYHKEIARLKWASVANPRATGRSRRARSPERGFPLSPDCVSSLRGHDRQPFAVAPLGRKANGVGTIETQPEIRDSVMIYIELDHTNI